LKTKSRTKRRPKERFVKGARLLKSAIHWTLTGDALVPYESKVGPLRMRIRLNDFPDKQLYTLLIGGREWVSFDDWPTSWTRPHSDPVVFEVRESDTVSKPLKQIADELRTRIIRVTMDRTNGDTGEVARRLGIDRTSLTRILRDKQ